MSGWVVRHGSCVEQELHESKSQGGVGKAVSFDKGAIFYYVTPGNGLILGQNFYTHSPPPFPK